MLKANIVVNLKYIIIGITGFIVGLLILMHVFGISPTPPIVAASMAGPMAGMIIGAICEAYKAGRR